MQAVIIGSGNVASHLSRGLYDAGVSIVQVYSRNLDHAQRLACAYKDCQAIDCIDHINRNADIYLIAVSDFAVHVVAEEMPKVNGIVAHTSGSIPLESLAKTSDRTAVLYPLQTFTREAIVELDKVPFFTEASDSRTLLDIDGVARLDRKSVV